MNAWARWTLTLLSAAVVVMAISWDAQDTGPGPITSVHAQVDELDGGRACAVCHGTGPAHLFGAAGTPELAQACLDCHAPIQAQLDQAAGLHGQLEPAQQQLCGSCHVEHLGHDVPLTGERSFRLAGHVGPDGFDHSTVDFHLDGRHDALACVDCHLNADLAVLPEGESRYLDRTQRCIDCHEDPHEGAMKRGCEECHGQEHDFDDLSAFPHDPRFPLHFSHGGLSCADCHETGSDRSVEALSDADYAQDPIRAAWRSCASCHDSPHRDAFLAGLPGLPAPAPGRDGCALCHSEEHRGWTGEEPHFESSWHGASGFALDAPHDGLDCAACHPRDAGQGFAEAYPGRAADSCAACHQDMHQGQFDHPLYADRGCLSCHARDRFAPHGFDLDAHAATRFPLEQSHQQVDCEACHDQLLGGRGDPAALAQHADPCRVFRGTERACEACHADAHAGAFAAREAELGPFPGGNCARCHDAGQFAQTIDPFDHFRWTGFALEGGHQTESCEDCHARSSLADELGRRFGRVAVLHPGDPAHCEGCHEDVHGGSFHADHLPSSVAGRVGCDRCHTVELFGTLHQAFDHGAWTGYALDGAHAQAECASCHGEATELRRFGRVEDHYPGDAARCATCHSDPHDGLFQRPGLRTRIQGRVGCARCHETLSFQAAALEGGFDHAQSTRFALSGAHAEASCSACHTELPRKDAQGRSFARAAGRDCQSCHADPHQGQFQREGRTDCLRCHDAEAARWELPLFDHSQTRYPLDATHARVDCASCHPATPLQGGGQAVRYRPLGTACADCHSVLPGPLQGDGR